jgi:hypothetical protein
MFTRRFSRSMLAVCASLGALVSALGAQSVSAQGAPTGACPTPQWNLFTVEFVLQHVPDPSGVQSFDVNGDGLTCVLFIDHGRVAIVDNISHSASR